MTAGLQLGVPGVYFSPRRVDVAAAPIRMDETGFVGIAPRGPVHTPIKLTSWSEYVRRFGGLPRPELGVTEPLLAHAVHTYFARGGLVAWVVRVVPPPGSVSATAVFTAVGLSEVQIEAADEGSWGNRLAITLEFEAGAEFISERVANASYRIPIGVDVVPHDLVRIRRMSTSSVGELFWVTEVRHEEIGNVRVPVFVIDDALGIDEDVSVSVVTGTLVVTDGDPQGNRAEKIAGLGLHSDHPRYVPNAVNTQSLLVRANATWVELFSPATGLLRPLPFELMHPGVDRWDSIGSDSFFDDGGANADPLDEVPQHRGVDAMGRNSEIGLLCVPDLFWRWSGPPPSSEEPRDRTVSGAFAPCETATAESVDLTPATAATTQLSAADPGELEEIVRRQQRVVDVADLRKRFVALLDVPFGLTGHEISRWRAHFGSSYAACYHPWLLTPGVQQANLVPPSSFAAGIIADREVRLGMTWGPANELATGAVGSPTVLTETMAASLFSDCVNVFRYERDGFRLASARTLSPDPQYRQLSVRRLMTMLTLTLDRIGQQVVFEPGTPALELTLTQSVVALLREMFSRGAFAGDTEAQSFFVRCDSTLNTEQSRARGQLIIEVGVAPASPLEFIVVRLVHGVDGVRVVTDRG